MTRLLSILYFVLAGLCEIGGGYLVWLWLREGKSLWYGALGAIILILYGVIPTLQAAADVRVTCDSKRQLRGLVMENYRLMVKKPDLDRRSVSTEHATFSSSARIAPVVFSD